MIAGLATEALCGGNDLGIAEDPVQVVIPFFHHLED
jgi:hypothetical protein